MANHPKIALAATAPIQKQPPKIQLPIDGMSRFSALAQFLPFGREKFRLLVREGKAPQPFRLSERCTCYKNSEVIAFLNDPINYRAEGFK